MAKATWIKVSGTWKQVKNVWEKVGGVWKQKVIPKGRVSGSWKDFISYFENFFVVLYGNNYTNNIVELRNENLDVISNFEINAKFGFSASSLGAIATDDKNFLYLAFTVTVASTTTMYIKKMDKNYNVVASAVISSTAIYKITPTADGGIIVGVGTYANSTYNIAIRKYDSNLSLVWSRSISGASSYALEATEAQNGIIFTKHIGESYAYVRAYDSGGNYISSYSISKTSYAKIECYNNEVYVTSQSVLYKLRLNASNVLELVWSKTGGPSYWGVQAIDKNGLVYIKAEGSSALLTVTPDGVTQTTFTANLSRRATLDKHCNVITWGDASIKKYSPEKMQIATIDHGIGGTLFGLSSYPGVYEIFRNSFD